MGVDYGPYSASKNIGLTASASRVYGRVRTAVAKNVGLTASASRVYGRLRTGVAKNIGLAASATRGAVTYHRAASSPLGLVATATHIIPLIKAAVRRTQTIPCVLTFDVLGANLETAAIDLSGNEISGLIIPAIDAADLTFEVCDTVGGTYVLLKTKGAATLTVSAAAGGFTVSASDLAGLAAYRFVKILCSVAQTATRTFKFMAKT